jgi:hypothetical protein
MSFSSCPNADFLCFEYCLEEGYKGVCKSCYVKFSKKEGCASSRCILCVDSVDTRRTYRLSQCGHSLCSPCCLIASGGHHNFHSDDCPLCNVVFRIELFMSTQQSETRSRETSVTNTAV